MLKQRAVPNAPFENPYAGHSSTCYNMRPANFPDPIAKEDIRLMAETDSP